VKRSTSSFISTGNSHRSAQVVELEDDESDPLPYVPPTVSETTLQNCPELIDTFKTVRESQQLLNELRNSKNSIRSNTEHNNFAHRVEEQDTVVLHLRNKRENKIFKFKIFTTDPLKKLVEYYSKNSQPPLALDRLILKYDGITLPFDKTPQDYGMQDKDELDIVVAALPISVIQDIDEPTVASYPITHSITSPPEYIGEEVKLKISTKTKEHAKFKFGKAEPLKKLFDAYCQQQKVNPKSVKFTFDGTVILPEQTPTDLDMEDEDLIDAIFS